MERALVLKILFVATWLMVGLTFSGVNYCQESYEFGSQSTVQETPTPSPTPTPDTGDDDDDSVVPSPTPSPTPTPDSGSETPTPSPSPTVTPTPDSGALLRALGEIGEKEKLVEDQAQNAGNSAVNSRATAQSRPSNWLGKAFEGEAERPLDSDGDGFTDWVELQESTDPDDAGSFPNYASTDLRARMLGFDDDYDGLSNQDEAARGTNPNQRETDDDGILDGAEVLSGSDPLNFDDMPIDSDSDGLSDQLELSYHTNPRNRDSDGDRLRDDMEIFLGTNPLQVDSDLDGILDGKEVDLGSDPKIAE